jgi:dipeptidase E
MNVRSEYRLFLISNSRTYGGGYLDHCEGALKEFLGSGIRSVLFVPFAMADRDAYAALAREKFASLGYSLESLHTAADPKAAIARAEALFIGGGNTFRLLSGLYSLDLLDAIRRMAVEGRPYLGASAGINVASPTIRTTNDMPIVEPPSMQSLGLVPFQINPHYLDADPSSRHMGETRETRIKEYLEENALPVIGLREGAWLRIEGGRMHVEGQNGAVVFRRGESLLELPAATDVDIASW